MLYEKPIMDHTGRGLRNKGQKHREQGLGVRDEMRNSPQTETEDVGWLGKHLRDMHKAVGFTLQHH